MASILGFFSVSPACAGMIPQAKTQKLQPGSEPRMRGDDPVTVTVDAVKQ